MFFFIIILDGDNDARKEIIPNIIFYFYVRP